jgi:hypothetical protein
VTPPTNNAPLTVGVTLPELGVVEVPVLLPLTSLGSVVKAPLYSAITTVKSADAPSGFVVTVNVADETTL